jgi:RNA polymerase sigma factor (sigma-70 family)
MWNRIMELQPLIHRCAVKMAFIYDEDAGNLEHDMMLALLDKSRANPTLLDKPAAYIFQTLKNLIHSAHRSKVETSSLDDELVACDDEAGDNLERQDRIESVRFVLEHLDDECRAVVRAILESGDLVRDSRHSRNLINVSAMADRMGRPKTSVYRDVSRLRSKLASSLAFA